MNIPFKSGTLISELVGDCYVESLFRCFGEPTRCVLIRDGECERIAQTFYSEEYAAAAFTRINLENGPGHSAPRELRPYLSFLIPPDVAREKKWGTWETKWTKGPDGNDYPEVRGYRGWAWREEQWPDESLAR